MMDIETFIEMGAVNELVIVKTVPFGVYLGTEENAVLLPKKEVPRGSKRGDVLKVFIYNDSKDRPIATTRRPIAMAGEFAPMRVRAVTGFGAFLDWGLEKDLLVPFSEQHHPMKQNQKYVVRVCFDERSDRLFATTKLKDHLETAPRELDISRRVDALVYDSNELGYRLIVENKWDGLVFNSDVIKPLAVGDRPDAWIKTVRPDGRLDLTVRAPGYSAVEEAMDIVLRHLTNAKGFLPFNDKSDPDEIRATFAMSKRTFKSALGGLYKRRVINITGKGVWLKKKAAGTDKAQD